jgi:hypothetical protein
MSVKSLLIGACSGVILAVSIVAYAARDKSVLGGVLTGTPGVLSIASSADGQTVFIAHADGIYKSVDGGETWRELPTRLISYADK